MSQPQLENTLCPHPGGQHRMAWWSWGDAQAEQVLVCVHGLTRQGRDFDRLARAMVERSGGRLQVICPDVVGRGRSEWVTDSALYQPPQYAADVMLLLQQRQQRAPIRTLDWVGTSMGGLIGMLLAGQPELSLPAPIRRLVLNDVGPAITWDSVARMQQYVGRYGRYADLAEAAADMRRISYGFGPVPEDIWLDLSAHMVRALPDGGVTLHYDPAIGEPVRALTPEAAQTAEHVLWALYDQVRAQVLLVRGMESDLLTEETAQAMTQRGPRAQLVQWPGVGHAPTLTDPAHIEALLAHLLAP